MISCVYPGFWQWKVEKNKNLCYYVYEWRKLHKIKKDTSEVKIRCFPLFFWEKHPIQRMLIKVLLFFYYYFKTIIASNIKITNTNWWIIRCKNFSFFRIDTTPFSVEFIKKGKSTWISDISEYYYSKHMIVTQ